MSDIKKNAATDSIGLALSGGGVRAAAFHAGVLRYLAERELLEKVTHISSVSGGTLFVGLALKHGNYQWPRSDKYLQEVFQRVRHTLTTQSLQFSTIFRLLFNPFNWRFLLSRANVLAQSIRGLWGVKESLNSLCNIPVWSINCTTGETGRRFRFKNGTMGDYELGYANVGDFSLAKAMAISAAFPGGIGPATIKVKKFQWSKRKQWNNFKSAPHEPQFSHLHLYDGGLYDNLGIEPMFDLGQQSLKKDDSLPLDLSFLLISDGGAPFAREEVPHPLNPLRFKRIADIALDQCRGLRVRSFINFLKNSPASGAYVGIGAHAVSNIKSFATGREVFADKLLREEWLSEDMVKRAASYSTTLNQLDNFSFDLLAQHGYETAKWNMEMMTQPLNSSEIEKLNIIH